MSRTDAHVPVWVRVNRRELTAVPWRAAGHGTCDLPPEPRLAEPGTACYWEFCGDGDHRVCSCELCYGSAHRRMNIRRERRRARQRLHAGRRRFGAGLDDMIGPRRRRDWWQ